ncbi:unnamed protein product, partial [Mesorhabditis belari]|uniref:Uncharacterized protein n=1 Tax=Mesorhabditis belari TaxID=2138241 RepID=A0AAF3F197_9BILA
MSQHGALIHPSFFEDYFIYLMLLEVILFFFLLLTLSIYWHLLTRKRVFHPNLNLILLVQPILVTIATLIRLLRHALDLIGFLDANTFQLFSFAAESFVGCSLHMTMGYALERFIAMRNLESYEQKFPTNRLGWRILFSLALFEVIEAILFFQKWAVSWVVFITSYFIHFIAIVFFIKLYFVCKQKYLAVYQKRYCTVEDSTLSNYKASRVMLFLAPYKSITSIFVIANYEYVAGYSLYTQTFFIFIFYYLAHFQIQGQMWLTIFYEPALRSKFLELTMSNNKIKTEQSLNNAFGKKLKYENYEQGDVYFRQFTTMWK